MTSDKTASVSDEKLPPQALGADLKGDLVQRSVRGGLSAFAGQGIKFIVNLGVTIILARLLMPGDFGLISMVAPIVGFVSLFKDLGLSQATIQQRSITTAQISTLFWINVALSVFLAATTIALAPLIGWFYGEPRLVWVTVVLGAITVCGGLTAQHLALIQRQMHFGRLIVVDVVSLLTGSVIGITAALCGLGYWALVLMTAANSCTNLALVWLASGWRPGLPLYDAGVKPMLAFGGNLTISGMCQYLNQNLDNVLIGKTWGDVALGLYGRAYSLLLLPLTQFAGPFSAIAIPVLSRITK